MKVLNIHQRVLHATPQQVGTLIDSLSSPADALSPRQTWPRMKFDRPLGVGATGGHGPIGYFVEAYVPGRSIRFRFTAPRGFDGWHGFEIVDATPGHCRLEHRLEMITTGPALLSWPLVFRPLHDALTEDSLSTAQSAVGNAPQVVPWSLRVRFLRWIFTPTKTARQTLQRSPHPR